MFYPNRTAFILGAGASWHYGYPTGEELVKKILDKVQIAISHCELVLNYNNTTGLATRPKFIARDSSREHGLHGYKDEWTRMLADCRELQKRLTLVEPLVIDYFLGQNPSLAAIGKFLIAWVLLECESIFLKHGFNNNRFELLMKQYGEKSKLTDESYSIFQKLYKDNWYRFLIHKLVTRCKDADALLENQVNFITFNYDVSLEYQLFKGLSALEQFSKDGIIQKFFETNRFIHVYGKIRDDPITQPAILNFDLFEGVSLQRCRDSYLGTYWNDVKNLFDVIYEASQGIRTIAPHEKIKSRNVERAKEIIDKANCFYILGYGFDNNNSLLLDLTESLSLEKTNKTVMFTNYGNFNLVNKNASRVFFGNLNPDRLLSDKPAILGTQAGSYLCEKSVRNVYDAFAMDFDAPEEQLGSTTEI